jgi:hypothetical protein
LKACVAWGVAPADVLSTFARSRCKQQVVLAHSKPCVAMVYAGAPFPCCLSSVFFKLRWTTNFGRKKTTRVLFNVILFSSRRYVSSCPSLVLSIVNQI